MAVRSAVWCALFCLVLMLGTGGGVQEDGDEVRAKELMREGEELLKAGEFHNAILSFNHAMELFRNKIDIVTCKMKLGLLYWNIGKLQKSFSYYHEGYLIAKDLDLKTKCEGCRIALEIHQQYKSGKDYYKKRLFLKSSKCYKEAIKLAEIIGSKEHILKCKRLLSIVYWEMSDLENFFSLSQERLKLAVDLRHKREIGEALNNLGLYYSMRSNYSHSLVNYLEALKIFRELKFDENISGCLNNIATIYLYLGSFQKALEYQSEALNIDRKLGNKIHISMNLNNLGEIYRRKAMNEGEKEVLYKSLLNFIDCLDLVQEIGEKKTEIHVINNIGNVYLDLKDYHKAILYLLLGLSKVKKFEDKESECMLFTNIGIAYSKLENYIKSEKFFKKAIHIGERIKANHILWEVYFGLGQNFEKLGKYPQAILYYEKTIEILDYVRRHILIDLNKAGFTRSKLQVYERLVEVYYNMHLKSSNKEFIKKAFNVIEKAKARALFEILEESGINVNEILNTDFKQKEKVLSKKIAHHLLQLSSIEISAYKRGEIEKELFLAEKEYTDLISRFKDNNPEIARLISPGPSSLEQIQKHLLDEETALLEYYLGENNTYLFVILKDKYEVFELPPRSEIHKSIRAYIKVMEVPSRKKLGYVLASKRIYKELLSNIDGLIPNNITRLIIAPDGVLNYLPFETLILPSELQTHDNDYLISKYTISYTPSASSLLLISKRKQKNQIEQELLVVGNPNYRDIQILDKSPNIKKRADLKKLYKHQGFDFAPLPYSAKEIIKISSFFPREKQKILLENQANEHNVKYASLEKYRIIHFACHAFLDEIFPYRSALVLSLINEDEEDGFLKVGEISTLKLRAQLVVLSACQTGKGKIEKGEGVLGLPRIFFYIGAKSVISTLWKIEDKPTAQFMGQFYNYLSKGIDIDQAMRFTKLDMMKSEFSHPFYWAGFVISGECSVPLFSVNRNFPY